MPIIATGSKTIIDLSDGKSLSVYLGANQPRTQIHDVNGNTYSPDWTTTAGKLVITPVVYANQTAIALNNSALTITWKRNSAASVPRWIAIKMRMQQPNDGAGSGSMRHEKVL